MSSTLDNLRKYRGLPRANVDPTVEEPEPRGAYQRDRLGPHRTALGHPQ